jgi:hypothetical protein
VQDHCSGIVVRFKSRKKGSTIAPTFNLASHLPVRLTEKACMSDGWKLFKHWKQTRNNSSKVRKLARIGDPVQPSSLGVQTMPVEAPI